MGHWENVESDLDDVDMGFAILGSFEVLWALIFVVFLYVDCRKRWIPMVASVVVCMHCRNCPEATLWDVQDEEDLQTVAHVSVTDAFKKWAKLWRLIGQRRDNNLPAALADLSKVVEKMRWFDPKTDYSCVRVLALLQKAFKLRVMNDRAMSVVGAMLWLFGHGFYPFGRWMRSRVASFGMTCLQTCWIT